MDFLSFSKLTLAQCWTQFCHLITGLSTLCMKLAIAWENGLLWGMWTLLCIPYTSPCRPTTTMGEALLKLMYHAIPQGYIMCEWKQQHYNTHLQSLVHMLVWPQWWSFADVSQQGLDFSKKISKRKIIFWFDFHRCSHGSSKSA